VYLFYVDIGALQDGLIIIIIMVFVVQLWPHMVLWTQ
jgi:hypothetical protein